MKQLILIALLVVCISPTAIKAQEVYKDTSGRFILDMTKPTGMPQNAVTSSKKRWSKSPSLTDTIPYNSENGPINATLYHKLEIAPNDMNTSGAMDGTGTIRMNWVNAFNGCRNSNYKGGKWRLPTQREMYMIYIFGETFVNKLGLDAFSSELYWTATEFHINIYNNIAWTINPTTGLALVYSHAPYNIDKANLYRVRCVREL